MKKLLRPLVLWWRRYFSEVGYVRREFNFLINTLQHWKNYQHRKAIAQQLTKQAVSDDPEILGALEGKGYYYLEAKDLELGPDLVEFCQEMAQPYLDSSLEDMMSKRPKAAKNYWLNLYQGKNNEHDPILHLAMHPRILSLVTRYMGEVPCLQQIEFLVSPPFEGDYKASQLWHLDNDQKKRIKIFYFPFEVGLEQGPTLAFPPEFSGSEYYLSFPDYFDDQQAVQFGLEPEQAIPFVGAQDSMYLADTSRVLHCGSRTQNTRFVLIVTYGSLRSYVWQNQRKLDLKKRNLDWVNDEMLEKCERLLTGS